jgi:prepilin-type N-terminal cleavage/methylation domain-containing protein
LQRGGEPTHRLGFTLAEVLITLGIIGVVAALTMPTLIANYQKYVTATRLKSTFSMLSQAVNLAVADNGDQNTWTRPKNYISDTAGQKDFFDKYIIKYLKLAQDCGNGTGSLTKGCVVINEGVSTELNTRLWP